MQDIKIALKLMRADKPIGSLLLLWPCLWSIWVSTAGKPNVTIIVYVIIGVFITRSAGCVINDIFDQDIDVFVARTKDRPLASSIWPKKNAWLLFILLGCLATAIAWRLDVLNFAIPTAICIAIYPKCKRFLAIPQAWLAMTWGLSTIIVWDACKVNFSISIFWLYLVTSFWTLAFDTLYAMVDRFDDRKLGVNSFAVLLGSNALLGICASYFLMLAAWIMFSLCLDNKIYCLLGSVPAVLIVYRILWPCRNQTTEKYFIAFKANNWLGFYLWFLIFLTYRQHTF